MICVPTWLMLSLWLGFAASLLLAIAGLLLLFSFAKVFKR